MAKIVFAVFGSLGDLHPHLALALELEKRGHSIAFATLEYYREKIGILGFAFFPMRPDLSPDDRELAQEFMDAKTGTEKLLRKMLFPALRDAFEDLMVAVKDCDLIIASEVAFAAPLIAEKFNLPLISTALSPGGFLSAYDPFVPPNIPWFGKLRFLGVGFHQILRTQVLDKMIRPWSEPVRALRREIGLPDNVEPILRDKYSKLLNLALFSRVLGEPQPDWHQPTVQTGFCFYDGKNDLGKMPIGLPEFLESGDPPIVFTLGSAAVWDARNFFDDSAAAAKKLNRRAILILGENQHPTDLSSEIAVFDYAPYSEVFSQAACIVHQGGVGTTAQALRAGVPQLIIPFSHDQPDNAARCVRWGSARTVTRANYNAACAASELDKLLKNQNYQSRAKAAKDVINTENGVQLACDAIEKTI